MSCFSNDPREAHIFVRARCLERFRWHFPPILFDHIDFYLLIRYPYVEMGINDAIQCAGGWGPLEDWREWGGCVRRIEGQAKAYLKAFEGASILGIELFGRRSILSKRVDVHVNARGCDGNVIVDQRLRIERDDWYQAKFSLQQQLSSDELIELTLDIGLGDVPPSPSTSLGECDIAVRRIWLSDKDWRGKGEHK